MLSNLAVNKLEILRPRFAEPIYYFLEAPSHKFCFLYMSKETSPTLVFYKQYQMIYLYILKIHLLKVKITPERSVL